MAHFAEIDTNNLVTRVLVITQEIIDTGNWGDPNDWVQTSYNTRGGVHYAPNSNEPDGGVALRKNYAGKGYTYDSDKDAFIPPKPYPSWELNEDTCQWESPTPYPANISAANPSRCKEYIWDEDTTSWVERE